jgi:hypothetical protein
MKRPAAWMTRDDERKEKRSGFAERLIHRRRRVTLGDPPFHFEEPD